MNHKRLLTFLYLVCFCQALHAAGDKKFALVRRIDGLELLSPGLSRQLEKVTLQVVTKQSEFELLLSGNDTPAGSVVNMVAVESEVVKSGTHYRIEARLIDVKTKNLLSKTGLNHIREDDLLRLFQGALESLFIEYDKTNETVNENDKKPVIPVSSPKKVPHTTQVKAPDESVIDFAKRVRELKTGVDKELVKSAEKKNENSKPKDADQSSTVSGLPANYLLNENFNGIKPNKVYERKHRLSLGWDSRQINSTGLVETKTKAQIINLRASGHAPTALFDGKTALSYDLSYSRPQAVPVEPPSIYQLGLYGSWLSTYWNTSAGLFRDATFFVNLPEPGGGLNPYSLTSTWMRLKTEISLPFKYPLKIGASYAFTMQAESDYKPLSTAKEWQGNHFHLELSPHYLVMGNELNFMMETLNLTTQGDIPFTFNESRLGFSVRRTF